MAEKKQPRQNFSGGMTTISGKVGEANSALLVKNLNIHEDPSYVTLSRRSTKVSGSTVTGLVHWAEDGSPWSTNRYFYDSAGKIYQETSAGTWSSLRTVSGGAGEGLVVYDRGLYYALGTEIGRYYPLNGTPAFADSFSGWWIDSQLQDSGGGTGAADYVPPTSISEAATARQTLTSVRYDPIYSITIDVDAVGSGDWTVTLHNTNNDTIASKTIANGSMSTGDVAFVMSTVGRVKINEDYHFHVTSTVADGGVDTSTATDLEAAEYTVQYGTLIDADFHPMIEMLNGIAIGNERYIAYFDGATYNPCRVVLPPGFNIRTLAKQNEFLVATCWRGASLAEAEEARRYFWDGTSPVFNYFNEIKVGAINAEINHNNNLFAVYGNKGSAFVGTEDPQEIIDGVPNLARGKVVQVYPGAIDIYEGGVLVGYGAVTDDGTSLEQGIYEYNSQTSAIPDSLSFPYLISTGTTQATTVKIGCVKTFGNDIYVGWRDDSSYGVDKIAEGDNSATSGRYEDRIFDNGDPNRVKQAIKIEIECETLTANQTITPIYKIDRVSSWTSGTAVSTSGTTSISEFINTMFHEIQWGFILAASDGSYPTITAINFIFDDLSTEGEA